jgi:hypothetical protein
LILDRLLPPPEVLANAREVGVTVCDHRDKPDGFSKGSRDRARNADVYASVGVHRTKPKSRARNRRSAWQNWPASKVVGTRRNGLDYFTTMPREAQRVTSSTYPRLYRTGLL